MKKYDVFYKKVRVVGFSVEANNEEEAKVVADNILRKDYRFDYMYDSIIEFDKTLLSDTTKNL